MLHAKLRNWTCQGPDRQGQEQRQRPSLQGPGQGQGLDLQGKDKDKDLNLVLKESLRTRTRTRINVTGTTWPASSSHITCSTSRSTTLCMLWKLLIIRTGHERRRVECTRVVLQASSQSSTTTPVFRPDWALQNRSVSTLKLAVLDPHALMDWRIFPSTGLTSRLDGTCDHTHWWSSILRLFRRSPFDWQPIDTSSVVWGNSYLRIFTFCISKPTTSPPISYLSYCNFEYIYYSNTNFINASPVSILSVGLHNVSSKAANLNLSAFDNRSI